MKCFFCGSLDSRVVDSRLADGGSTVRRRRKCGGCGNRFTTYEKVEETPVVVVKRDGRREVFDRDKVLNGLLLAGQKRPIPLATFEDMIEDLERDLRSRYKREVTTDEIGAILLDKLSRIDEVAYVRFASVFRQFKDIDAFRAEMGKIRSAKEDEDEKGDLQGGDRFEGTAKKRGRF